MDTLNIDQAGLEKILLSLDEAPLKGLELLRQLQPVQSAQGFYPVIEDTDELVEAITDTIQYIEATQAAITKLERLEPIVLDTVPILEVSL